jgi:hypothetical protein
LFVKLAVRLQMEAREVECSVPKNPGTAPSGHMMTPQACELKIQLLF